MLLSLIDPRCKELPFPDSFSKQDIIEQVEDELISLECDTIDQQMVAEEEGEAAIEDEEPPVSKKKKDPISKLIRDLFEEHYLLGKHQRRYSCVRLNSL